MNDGGRDRRDMVVVLARGRGSRMGQPKAGLRLPGDDRTFLARILDLHGPGERPVVVVTGQGGSPSCLAAAQGREVVIIEGPKAGDTALTLLTARRHAEQDRIIPTHWWAHPVDLPLVIRGTLDTLATVSVREPDRVVRPVHEGRVGHPVVIPDHVLATLEQNHDWHEAPLRHFLDHRCKAGLGDPLRTVTVPDFGVVHDFDQPADLEAWRSKTGGPDEQP